MRARFALALVALAVGGCAKFPANGANSNFTRLVFRYTMAQPIDPNYIYVIAIRPIHIGDTDVDTNGPIPVVLTGSKNGFVEGRPTRFIRYDESVAELYNVFQFPFRTTTPDDDNPVNLAAQVLVGPVIANTGVDPRPGNNGGTSYGRQLGFDIDTRYLADSDDEAKTIVAIQFNILTMNKTALNSTGDRVMDALGDSRSQGTVSFNDYRQIPITTSAHYFDQGSTDDEQANDTFNGNLPPIDIVDWDLEVRTP